MKFIEFANQNRQKNINSLDNKNIPANQNIQDNNKIQNIQDNHDNQNIQVNQDNQNLYFKDNRNRILIY